MTRQRRLHAPGSGFHLTARTQFGTRWFTGDFCDDIVELMCAAARCFNHELLAFAVMPNHLHMVVRQSHAPLGWMMHQLLHRIAIRVQERYDTSGHVFGTRYWAGACQTPQYLRRAIVYTHLNPVAAGLCSDPADYKWTSHAAYVGAQTSYAKNMNCDKGLLLFADDDVDRHSLVQSYMHFVNYTSERRASGVPGDWLLPAGPWLASLPAAPRGDLHWATSYSSFTGDHYEPARLPAVSERAAAILERLDSSCTLDMIRNAGRRKAIIALRRQIIEALSCEGYRTSRIARCLGVSFPLVSRVRGTMRESATRQQESLTP